MLRCKWLQIRLTEEEYEFLRRQCGGRVSEYVRSILCGRSK